MVLINTIEILPPLLNSSCAWSSDFEQLTELYESPYTGAVTTRSATDRGFQEDGTHTVAFSSDSLTTINSFGYSPHPLSQYLKWIENIFTLHPLAGKPVIISIAASDPTSLGKLLRDIQALRESHDRRLPTGKCRVAVEFNLSCPNIDSSPLGYIQENVLPFVIVMRDEIKNDPTLTIGCKLPPYLYQAQFTDFLEMLSSVVIDINGEKRCPISFLTSTNTLGNSLLFSSQARSATNTTSSSDVQFALPTPLGGLAGESIHALSLGNVFTFRRLISSRKYVDKGLGDLKIIGVGGVTSKAAVERMRQGGADAVACATLFGTEGVRAFEILTT